MEKDFAGPLKGLESAVWSLDKLDSTGRSGRLLKKTFSIGVMAEKRGALIQGRQNDPLNHTK